LGFGTRFGDMINKSDAPSPQRYNIRSSVDTKKGIIFGVGREKFLKV
jgi:hypothetical protein